MLSNLGDATFDLQAFSLGASSNTGLRGLNQSTFSTGRLEASHVVSVTQLEGQNLVCKEAAHKVRIITFLFFSFYFSYHLAYISFSIAPQTTFFLVFK